MKSRKNPKRALMHRLSETHLRWLTGAVGVLTVVNIFVPDVLPLLDEFILIWIFVELAQEMHKRKRGRRRAIDVDE